MNGMNNPILFYPIAFFLILFAIISIKSKNIFSTLLSAIIVFYITGLLFYILGTEYNAVIQIAIYGIAVPVILGIAVMFTNLKNVPKEEKKEKSVFKFLMILTGSLFILALCYLVLTSLVVIPKGFNIVENAGINYISVISAFSKGIYSNYVWAFELVSLMLTIIVVGLTIFQKGESECTK